jgi:hypothetical protein
MVITVILGILALILLYRQNCVQRYRIGLDLYDRRFKMYYNIRKFILTGSMESGTKLEVIQEFLSYIPEYELLIIIDYNSSVISRL